MIRKKLIKIVKAIILVSILTGFAAAQKPLTELSWQKVATGMPDEWYGSADSKRVAENVLLYQRNIGGWPKNTPFHKPLTEKEKIFILKEKDLPDAIFDNGATTTEMRFLAKMYSKTGIESYKEAFVKGLHFILTAQYSNGGWPMFFPLRKGYYTHITFNDDAMFRLMNLLKDIFTKKPLYDFINDGIIVSEAKSAYDHGIDCILKTQIVVNGKPTIWCAQHDENTFLPAKARAYELPSFSGGESAGLLELLMDIENPTPEIIRSVQGGIAWLDVHKLKNIRLEIFTNTEGKKDRRIVSDPKAGNMWARFYDLETGLPFVSDRDGIKKSTLEEIGYERRNGYSWYSDKPQKFLDAYPVWKAKWVK
jgi:PelA/Pel-15E family pectate lyase